MARLSGISLLLSLLSLAGTTAAQTFPNRTITLINTTSPGVAITIMHRAMADEWARRLGQPVIMDQRAGASGRLGLQALMRARGDGHMLTPVSSGNGVTLPLVEPDTFNVQPDRDYTPLSFTFYSPTILVANPALPFRDIKGLIAYAKANPGKLNWGNQGIGSSGHMGAELFKRATGIDFVHVPYKDNLIQALAGGDIHLGTTSAATGKPLIDAGRIVAIANAGPARMAEFPNLATMQEQGVRDYSQTFWFGIAAPPQTPPEVAQKLAEVMNETLKVPEVAKHIQNYGGVQNIMSPRQFSDYIRADLERYGPVVKSLGIKPGG